ncbi:putative cytochrome P450 monooxygenase [Stipitochalara longipes BDJ]|nr:putative cytochrome P450 monooxygenase [Stipitochalara longipes BDJ]
MLPFVLVSAVAFLTALVYKYIIYPGFISPFSKVPKAHSSVPYTSLWIRWKRPEGTNAIQTLLEAHRKHGPIVRLSPDELSVASLDGLRQIYTGGFEKAQEYEDEFMNYGTPNLVSMLQNRPHSVQKRMISHVYSKSYLQNSVDLQALSKVLLFERMFPALQSAAQDDKVVDAYGLSQALGADFVTAFLFGIDNGTDFIRDILARKKFMTNYWAKKDGMDKKRATEEVEAHILSLCRGAETLLENLPTTRPVVHGQLSSQLSKSSVPPQQRELVVASEMMDHISASIDTTTITMTYLEWEMSRNPDLQSALRQELRSLTLPLLCLPSSGKGEQRLPDSKELDALPLLNAVLKEVLRVYPPSPALLDRVTPPGGAVIEGYDIPGGITVGTSAKVMHMNEKVFSDAELFRPERWLADGTEEGLNRIKEMNRWFWAFGSGGRMCIGNHFAIHMLKTIVAAIYTNYETTIVDDEGIEQEDAFLAGPVGRKLVLKVSSVSAQK